MGRRARRRPTETASCRQERAQGRRKPGGGIYCGRQLDPERHSRAAFSKDCSRRKYIRRYATVCAKPFFAKKGQLVLSQSSRLTIVTLRSSVKVNSAACAPMTPFVAPDSMATT